MSGLLLTVLRSPFGTTRQFRSSLKFEEPKNVSEANIVFVDVGVGMPGSEQICSLAPEIVVKRREFGEQIEEELVSTPFAVVKLYSTGDEFIGAVIFLCYSSRIFVQECQAIKLSRSGNQRIEVEQKLEDPRKIIVEPRKFPESLIARQPEDRDFWVSATNHPRIPLPPRVDAIEARKRPDFVAQIYPSWIEEIRYLREIAYVLAALLVTLLGREACSGFARKIAFSDSILPTKHWFAHLCGAYVPWLGNPSSYTGVQVAIPFIPRMGIGR